MSRAWVATNPEEDTIEDELALITIAEVAITLAGFSGIVAAST